MRATLSLRGDHWEKVDVHACQGCGLCVLACPNHALALETVACGEFFLSDSRYGPMAHARLYPGGESSGRLVTEALRHAEVMAMGANLRLILIDGPPGIGCSATAALVDVDLAVVVTGRRRPHSTTCCACCSC